MYSIVSARAWDTVFYIFSFDFTGDLTVLKDKPMTIKEGSSYKIKITFKVNVEHLTVNVRVILGFCFPFDCCKNRKENSPLRLVFYFEIDSFPMLLLLLCRSLRSSYHPLRVLKYG